MTPPQDPTPSIDPLDALIASYVQAVEAGQVPNRRELLDRNPKEAEALQAFFADFDRIDRVASPLRLAGASDETAAVEANGPARPPTVRYFGDYELLEEIAQGGMGVVYKARQTTLNRLVALKMILTGTFATPREVARFQAEAEAAANLDHPHIVPVYEVGEHQGQQYFSMKFIEGSSLAKHPRGDLKSEVRSLIIVARAVHHAHQHGVLHRDLKPSNVLIDPQGEPHVTDFGLAKRLTDLDRTLTEPGQILGTPRYMAPEQAAGRKDLTVAADVYSLGVILYERLTGQTPFTGADILTLLRQVREADPPRPSTVRPGLDRDLETVVLKCLEKDPARRYPTAADLVEDLTRWLEGRPITARPVGQAEKFARWCRRNPALSSSFAIALLACIMTAGLSLLYAGARSREARLLSEALKTSEELRDEAESKVAKSSLDQGMSLGKKGDSISGLLHIAEAMRIVPKRDVLLEQSIRRALAASTMNFPEAATHLETDPQIHAAIFSRNGKSLLTAGDDGIVRIFDPKTGRLRKAMPLFDKGKSISKLAIRHDGTAALACDGQQIRTYNLNDGKPLGPPIPFVASAREMDEISIQFNLDGSHILIRKTIPNTREARSEACVWDARTGKLVGPLIHYLGVPGSAGADFRPDGQVLLARVTDQEARLFDTQSGETIGDPIRSGEGEVISVAFDPEGQSVITGESRGTVHIRDAQTGRIIGAPIRISNQRARVLASFSRDGRTILTMTSEAAWLWDTASKQMRATVELDGETTNMMENSDTNGICVGS